MTRLRTVYVLKEDGKAPATKPSAFIEVTASGSLVYGVRVCARSLTQARRLAVEEFTMGAVEYGRCGGVLRYEWMCCVCDHRGRTIWRTVGPGMNSVSVAPWDEKHHAPA